MSARAASAGSAPREGFSLAALTNYADPAQMALWMEQASPGAVLIYATGPWLGNHAAAAMAREWQAQHRAELWQTRAARANCFDYHARKLPPRPAAPVMVRGGGDGDCGRMLALLEQIAAEALPCPTNEALADELGLGSKWKARHLFDRLVASGAVRLIEPARFGARVIEIAETGARTAPSRAG